VPPTAGVCGRGARDAGRLRDVTGLEAVRLVVAAGSSVAGSKVRSVRWPERTILTGVQRGTRAIVPGGDTDLQPEDVVVALTAHPDALRTLLLAAAPSPTTPDPTPEETR
jgi:Trk K+ transport system NAD-binding subunit